MSGATIAPSLPAIKEIFSEVPNVAFLTKMVLTIPALFIAFSGPLVGAIINRFGRLKLLYASLILCAFSGSTRLWMNDLYSILIGRALLGVAVGGIMTIGSTLVGDYFAGEERNKFTGLQSVFMSVGGIVFVGGLGTGLMMPNATLWLLEITPSAKRGAVMVFFTSALYIGQFASPLLSQPITDQVGLSNTFVALSLVAGGVGLAYLLSKNHPKAIQIQPYQ